jgi:hypothetical protein
MLKLIFVPAVALLMLGAEGVYHSIRAREEVTTSCDQFARARPSSPRVHLTGCEIDYAAAAYRESGTRIEELYLPVRPAGEGTGPAPIVVATRDPTAIAVAQSVLGGSRVTTPEQSIAVMRRVVEVLRIATAIDGLTRTGVIERLRSRRILSGFATPVANDVSVIDLRGTPDFLRPAIPLAAGLLLALVPLLRSRRAPADVVPEPSAGGLDLDLLVDYAHDEYFPVTPESGDEAGPLVRAESSSVTLPGLLLLNLDVSAGPESIESAPPLGARADIVAILSGVIPDLHADHGPRRLTRPDGAVRLDLGLHDPVPTVVVEARGQGGIALVKEVLLMTGWRAFVPKTGLFVSVDDLEALAALAVSKTDAGEKRA